jgi:hypothetical protein
MVSADLPDTCKTPTRDLERRGRTCRDHQVFQRHPVRAARPSSKLGEDSRARASEGLSAASRRVGDSWCLVVVFNFVGWGEWDCNSTATASADRRGTGGVRLLSGQAGPGQVRSGQAVRGTAYKLQLADGTGGACRETSARLARLGSTQVSICRSEQERACRTAVLIRRANTRGKLTLHSTQAFRLSLCPPLGARATDCSTQPWEANFPTARSCASHPKCCIAELRYGSVRRTRESWWRASAAALSLQVTACGLATEVNHYWGLPTAWGTTASPGGTWFPGRRRRRVCGVQVRSAKCREHCIHRFHSLHSAPPPSTPRLRHALPRKATA